MTEKTFDRAAHMRAVGAKGAATAARNRALKRLSAAVDDVQRTGGTPDPDTARALRELLARAS